MFHNVLMTTLTPIRDTNEVNGGDNRSFATIWSEVKEEKFKDVSVKKTIKKKKRNRTMFTTEQVRVLEKIFARSKYIDVERRREISECLQIEQKCIKIWFQNRRMKEKKELSQSCDSTSESIGETMSPPLCTKRPPSNQSDTNSKYLQVHNPIIPNQYNYYASDNYFKREVDQNEQTVYETSNNLNIPDCFNYDYNGCNTNVLRNHIDYSTQYYRPQTERQDYYNTEEVNNQYLPHHVHGWPSNMYDTSYFYNNY